jgi:hypothetical protein
MRLTKLIVENFRCYCAPIAVTFEDLTAFIGLNDVGKSALMDALAIFFEVATPDKDDACMAGDRTGVRITCEFSEVPEELVIDADFHTTLAGEFLLNSEGRLSIRKTYDGSLVVPKLRAVEAIAMHPTAEGFGDLLKLKKAELIARARELKIDLDEVNKQANAPIRAAIWATADDLALRSTAGPLDAEGCKQIWAVLGTYLPTFALFKSDRASTDQDQEAQDPLKAAIREAIKAKEDDLRRIKEYVETEVQKIANDTVAKLREMDATIAETLNPVITTKKWDSLFQTSITGDEGIPLNKRGSGVKRLVLLNFFRAKAERGATDAGNASVIYAVEEPETSQHPRNQRMLLGALRELSSTDGRQVILTTHTPMLARYLPETALRHVKKDEDGIRSIVPGSPETNAEIARSLGVLPDHNVKLFIGVEGAHDIAFLKGIARVLRAEQEDVPDLAQLELDGEIIFFPFGGSNLALWASRLQPLNRPEYHICDRDNPPPAEPSYADHIAAVEARDGCQVSVTNKREMENYLHCDAIREAYAQNGLQINLHGHFDDFDDVPLVVAERVHAASGGDWGALSEIARAEKVKRAKRQLNGQAVVNMTAQRLTDCDPQNEVRGWLATIGQLVTEAD